MSHSKPFPSTSKAQTYPHISISTTSANCLTPQGILAHTIYLSFTTPILNLHRNHLIKMRKHALVNLNTATHQIDTHQELPQTTDPSKHTNTLTHLPSPSLLSACLLMQCHKHTSEPGNPQSSSTSKYPQFNLSTRSPPKAHSIKRILNAHIHEHFPKLPNL